jgi:SAM-dependent methyltransferase
MAEDVGQVKARVRAWWNARPCGSRVSLAEVGSRAFFDEVERHRYAQEPYIPDVVRFDRWKGARVLEIGCGLGTDLLRFARAGAHVTGIDLTPRAVELTARRLELEGLRGDVRTGDAESLDFADGTFDLVYSHGVLHHTPDTARAFAEVHRVLKPGGMAIVMLYHKHSYNYWINIRLLRAAGFWLLRRGSARRWLRAVSGASTDLLREYERSATGAWTFQDLLNNNTDGPGNPLSKVFTRRQVRALCAPFSRVQTRVHWLVKKNVPVVGRYLPDTVDRLCGRLVGWSLYVIATK